MSSIHRWIVLVLFLVLPVACICENKSLEPPHFSLEAKALYATASAASAPEGTPISILQEGVGYVFDASGRHTFTIYTVYKILNQQGANGWSSISVLWEPWHQQKPRIRARIITPDLAVHELDMNTLTDAPARDQEADTFGDRRVLRGPLPAIAPGSVVEQEIMVEESSPLFSAGTAHTFYLGEINAPVQSSRFTVEAPASLPLRFSTQLLPNLQPQRTEKDGRVQIVFEHGPLEALEQPDDFLPSDVPHFPSITISTGESWAAVASHYSEIVESHIAPEAVKSLVAKVVAGKNTLDEKALAILQFVSREIRYTGIEFSDAAIVPRSPTETLTRKYGDCKDKAVLLSSMLRAANIPAYVALLKASGRMDIPPELPGINGFDHAIVYVPGKPESWIDATDQYARLAQLPMADQGRLALIVRRETTGLVKIPESPSESNKLVELRDMNLAEYGAARIVETSQPHGALESPYRRSFSDKNDKTTRSNLLNYVKRQYLADKLDRFESSSPDDLTQQFELVLESQKAKRGFTDLDSAVAAIRLEGLFDRLPSLLREAEGSDSSDTKANKPKRTADYQLPQPFVTEWRYTITPPAGFKADTLPPRFERRLGPCLLTQEFSLDKDGRVLAKMRFDSVKRRFTITEADDLRQAIVRLLQAPVVQITFRSAGQALAEQGKFREALGELRRPLAAQQNSTVQHLRIAKVMLFAGLAESARSEAQAAVKLDPKSALAWQTLAGILEYDLVGRRFRPGTDWEGAKSAYKKAEELDPDDKSIVASLGILLEHNKWGLRYGPGADIKGAITEYRKLKPEEQADAGISNNLPFALFYAGEFAEAQKVAEALSSSPLALLAASEAALHGSAAGLSKARSRSSGEQQFRDVASAASDMLENLRLYSLAADFKEAGASGENSSDMQAMASLLRHTQLHEKFEVLQNPVNAAARFQLLTNSADITIEQLRAMSSRNGAPILADAEVRDHYAEQQRHIISGKARKGLFAEVGVDLSVARMQPAVTGSDEVAYKVILYPSASYKAPFYIVREDGSYKVLGYSRYYAGVGLEVLDRINANQMESARSLLDWLREDVRLPGGDDPLSGPPFPRIWTKGRSVDAQKMSLAAASILATTDATSNKAIPILELAAKAAASDTERGNIENALQVAYFHQHRYADELAVLSDLAQLYPESESVFQYQEFCLRELKKFTEADQLAQDRLRRLPSDYEALSQLATNAIQRGQYPLAIEIAARVINGADAHAGDFNNIAWFSLFSGTTSPRELEAALKAGQLSKNDAGALHTLGCVYAELGKLKEARDVLLEAMDAGDLDEPDADYWYAFGRVAEKAGEYDAAIRDYARVKRPKEETAVSASAYHLAQIHLVSLKNQNAERAKPNSN